MPRQINRLSALQVKNLDKPGLHGDGNGLYLQITPRGSRSWLLRYMVAGKTHAMGLGPAHLVSLAEAREKAQSAQRELLEGINPLEKKRERKRLQALSKSQMMTFSECAKTYIEAHKSGWKSEKHASQWANTLKTYAGPVFGELPVAEVETSMVVNCLSAIWTTKHETASRLRGRIERVLGWATTSGYRSGENPARWKGHLENLLARRNVLDEPKNSPSLPWKRIPEYMPALQALNSLTAKALTLLILTGTRSNEVRFATWDELDLENRCWTIPAPRMKAGVEHEIPLSPAVLELLTSLTRTNNLVFPNDHGCPFSDMTLLKVARSIKDQDGGPYRDSDGRPITVQGFRSSFRMWAAEATDYPREIAEHAIAHKLPDPVERAYQRGTQFPKRIDLMRDWAIHCTLDLEHGSLRD